MQYICLHNETALQNALRCNLSFQAGLLNFTVKIPFASMPFLRKFWHYWVVIKTNKKAVPSQGGLRNASMPLKISTQAALLQCRLRCVSRCKLGM